MHRDRDEVAIERLLYVAMDRSADGSKDKPHPGPLKCPCSGPEPFQRVELLRG